MQQLQDDKLWSVGAEAAVLGSILFDDNCLDKILGLLPSEECFFDRQNRLIYSALLRLYTEKVGIDGVTLRDELNRACNLGNAGGAKYIQEILDTTPSSANAVYYARIVREKWQYRELIKSVGQIRGVLDEPLAVDELIQKVQDIALGLKADRPEAEFFALADHVAEIAEQREGQQKIIPTGVNNIDRLRQGVSPGDFCIIAGRPSMGKSTLALDIAINMAKSGKSVLFFTLEMTHKGLIERAIVGTGKVAMPRVRQGLTDYEIGRAREAADELKPLDIIFHEAGTTPEKQIAFIRTRKKTHGVDVVFIDYLQLMSAGTRTENRVQEISTISRKLKLAAGQEHIPIIALSQLNRQVEARTSHRPRMSDLRDSGAIEQDADIVMLLHREDYYRNNDEPGTRDVDGTAEVIIAKARNSLPGIAKLTFLDEIMKFADQPPRAVNAAVEARKL